MTAWLDLGRPCVAEDRQVFLYKLIRGLPLVHPIVCTIKIVLVVSVFGDSARTVPDIRPELNLVIDDLLHREDDTADSNLLASAELKFIFNFANFQVLDDEPQSIEILFVFGLLNSRLGLLLRLGCLSLLRVERR